MRMEQDSSRALISQMIIRPPVAVTQFTQQFTAALVLPLECGYCAFALMQA
jgi:hypothetical protein